MNGGTIGGFLALYDNAPGGDCNNDGADLTDVGTAVEPGPGDQPRNFSLGAAYPNPFNPATIIPYELSRSADVRLELFDTLGRRIRVLDAGNRPAGRHEVLLDASDLPSGIYLYRMNTAGFSERSGSCWFDRP